MNNKAIFLDRDGVIIKDNFPITSPKEVVFFDDTIEFFNFLSKTEYIPIVVTNQTVISRGLINEDMLIKINLEIDSLLIKAGVKPILNYYYCPHHPKADLLEYRLNCSCRKPNPGLLLKAKDDFNLDLSSSVLVGDRSSDIIAGNSVNCRTILLKTGGHLEPLIDANYTPEMNSIPDRSFSSLSDIIPYLTYNDQ